MKQRNVGWGEQISVGREEDQQEPAGERALALHWAAGEGGENPAHPLPSQHYRV